MMVRVIVFLVGLVVPSIGLAQAPNAVALDSMRVAAFSPQRVFAESPDGRSAFARMNALQTERAAEMEKRNKDIASQEAALADQGAFLSDDARRQRSRELERMRLDVQRFIQDAQAELMGIQRDVEAAFVVKLKPIVDQLASERQLQLILSLDADFVVWIDPSLDLTAEVLKRLSQ